MVGAEGFEPVWGMNTKIRIFCDLDPKQRKALTYAQSIPCPAFYTVYTRDWYPPKIGIHGIRGVGNLAPD